MRLFFYIALLGASFGFLSCMDAGIARAEVKAGSGMHYTRVQGAATTDNSYIRSKTIKHDDESGGEEKKEEGTSQARIWNKYKALAAGTATDGDDAAEKEDSDGDRATPPADDETAESEGDEKDAIEKDRIEKEPAPPGGIAGLIDEYKKNKQRRSQMHSITVTDPDEGHPPAALEKTSETKEKPEG